MFSDEEAFNVFQILSLDVSKRPREVSLSAKGIKIYMKDSNLISYEFQKSFKNPTQSSIILSEEGLKLFKEKYKWSYPIRSLGIRAINLIDARIPAQIDIFSDYKKIIKKERIDKAIYDIRKKYDRNIVTFASLKDYKKFPKNKTEIVTLPNSKMI
ncbi:MULTISPECIES: hypothetical protein [Anaerococcus]|uniref:DinB/UmuC family translesion DNA polymerase n=1 Tax=Anaerococcus TaxID=165779 RepID=UPI001E531C78|nr:MULTISPECIES: hypothetical protein [Anaerococcus]MDY3006811.1 hypothetical protein [Anaerococcus porci]